MGADRRVAICRRGSDVTVIATVPEWVGEARIVRRCVAGSITPTGYVQARPLPQETATADGTVRTPIAAAIAELGPFDAVDEYPALFGHVVLDQLYLLVATRAERAVELPFGRAIQGLKNTKWIPVKLSGVPPPRATRKDRMRVDHFLASTFDEGYYWSDDVNVSTLFPHRPTAGSSTGIATHDPSCCDWSVAMRAPYAAAGCGEVCSALIRGFARGVKLAAGDDDDPVWVHMLGRQNRLNAGPRYFGRGLNEVGQAGNDHVYELVVWRYASGPASPSASDVDALPTTATDAAAAADADATASAGGAATSSPPKPPNRRGVRFTRHVYLRGTVPLRFKSKLSTSGIGEAAIIIDDDVYDGAPEYIARQVRLLDALHAESSVTVAPSAAEARLAQEWDRGSSSTVLQCLNLLKSVSAAGEDLLTKHFGIALERANAILLAAGSGRRQNSAEQHDSGSDAAGPSPPPSAAATESSAAAEDEADGPAGSTEAAAEVDATMMSSVALAASPVMTALGPGVVPPPMEVAGGRQRPRPPLNLVNVDWLGLQKDHGTPGACCAIWDNNVDFLGESPVTVGTVHLADERGGDGFDVATSVRQRRFIRANCADSLDRTNVAMFFTVAKLFAVIVAGAGVDPTDVHAPLPSALKNASDVGAASPASRPAKPSTLPAPLEEDPTHAVAVAAAPSAQARFDAMVADMPPALMRALVELFVANGDCVAQLYTSTGALHTSVMRALVPGMKEAPSNGIISAQRRYENMFRDKKKRRVLEAMLGVRLPLHFPSFQGTFSLMPLAHELWPCALVVMGLDASKPVKPETISVALQAHWIEIQAREGVEFATSRLSNELPVRIGVDPTSVASARSAVESTPSKAGDSDAATVDGTNDGGALSETTPAQRAPQQADGAVVNSGGAKDDEELGDGAEIDTADRSAEARELMAVVVLPSADIAREIMMRGALPIRYGDGDEGFASVHPYAYTVETRDLIATSSPVGKVVSAASSLKRKLLRLVQ